MSPVMNTYDYQEMVERLIKFARKNKMTVTTSDPAVIPYADGNILTYDNQGYAPEDWYSVSGSFASCRKDFTEGFFIEVIADFKLIGGLDRIEQVHTVINDDYIIQDNTIRMKHKRIKRDATLQSYTNR